MSENLMKYREKIDGTPGTRYIEQNEEETTPPSSRDRREWKGLDRKPSAAGSGGGDDDPVSLSESYEEKTRTPITGDIATGVVLPSAASAGSGSKASSQSADNVDSEFVATEAFVVKEELTEQEREEIRRQAGREYRDALAQSAIDAARVSVVRVRSRREKLVLWCSLISGLILVVLAVILGVVFGVVIRPQTIVENDDCLGAVRVPIFESAINASTAGAAPDNETIVPTCWANDGRGERSDVGLWYYLDGDESYVFATTCSNDNGSNARLLVFSGSSCDELKCIVSPPLHRNDSKCGENRYIMWKSMNGTRYYIYVSQVASSASGAIELTVSRRSRYDLMAEEIKKEFAINVGSPGNDRSPQVRAAEWLSGADPFIKLPILGADQQLEFQQRYALATFYFSTNGESWKDQVSFLNPVSVCEWKRDRDTGARGNLGVSCDEMGVVRDFFMGEYRKGE